MEVRDYVDNRRHGSSNASFTFYYRDGGVVTKEGDYRVGQQGNWLKQFDSYDASSLPTVYKVGPSCYEMELLTDLPRDIVSVSRTLEKVIGLFFKQVWPIDFVHIPFNPDIHNLKLAQLFRLVRKQQLLSTELIKLQLDIDWGRLAPAITHGDPTFDNVMMRGSTGELVVIDPIPATPAVPDLRSVDLGKMLQSVMGFERIRYGEEMFDPGTIELIGSACSNDNEWAATRYWCSVHLLRAIPYMPEEGMKRELEDLAFHVLRAF